MKMYNKIIVIFLVAWFAIIMGCDVFDLDEDPKHFIAPEGFYNNPDQIESVFAAVMRNTYRNWGVYGYPRGLWHNDYWDFGDLNIQRNHGAGFYTLHFANIKDLNFAIHGVKNNLVGTSGYDKLLGQAKFLRAWNYFQLVRMWGPVPLLTDDDVDDYFNLEPVNSTIPEIYELIISDWTDAINKLPSDWGNLVGRPTSDAAKGLLAKAYITMATAPLNDASYYPKAAALAKEIMDAGNYSLVEDINDVFRYHNQYGPEIMWGFNANEFARSQDPRALSGIYGWGDFAVDREWTDSYPEQPRKHIYVETMDAEGRTFHEIGRFPGVGKFLVELSPDDIRSGIGLINVPVIRFADVLLIFAEATNMTNGGPTQEAVDAVNAIIDRANNYEENPNHPRVNTDMSKDEFDRAVILERKLELCFEGDRWFDLIRKRIIPEECREHKVVNFKEHMYLFPIPDSEFRTNPNIKQNPGY